MDLKNDDTMAMLLCYASECPELYNEINRRLYKLLGENAGAELVLVCTYITNQILSGR